MTEKILFVPDSHVPYHDKRAMALMLRTAAKIRFDRIVILGDWLDMFKVSFHERTLDRRQSLAAEIKEGNKLLDVMDALGAKKKHFVAGNHEHRLNRYMAERAPELAELPGHTVPELLRLRERGWSWTPYRKHFRVGKLWVTHDEGASGPMACVAARATFNASVVIGHCHAMTYSVQGDARGKSRVGASFGWLGDRERVDYMHASKSARWTLGFGAGLMDKDGVVHLQACPVVNGRVAVFGEVYS